MAKSLKATLSSKEGVVLDAMRLLDSRLLVCANSGAGKSYLIRRLLEQLAPKIPTLILDREGEFGTLRESVDVVLVGEEGEVSTSIKTAAKLARRLTELRVSAVVDLYELRKPDKRLFVKLFLESLLSLPRKLWAPTLVVIDEAHEFAPEHGRDATSREAVIALMDQGRKRGLCGILATQRLAKLDKDAAAEANNLAIGRFAQDLDLRRASDLLGFSGKSQWPQLRDSKPGQFFGLGPAFEHTGVKRFRVEKVKTTHPKPGQRHKLASVAPSRAIQKVSSELADLKEQVEKEENEVVDLRRRCRELQAELVKTKKSKTNGVNVKEAINEAVAKAMQHEFKRTEKTVAPLRRLVEEHNVQISRTQSLVEDYVKKILGATSGHPLKNIMVPPTSLKKQITSVPMAHSTVSSASTTNSEVPGGGVRRILIALAQQYPNACSRAQLGLLSGFSSKSGTYATYLGKLRTNGWISSQSGEFVATEDGIEALGNYEPLPTGDKLIEYWKTRLGSGGLGRIFEVLVTYGETGISREDLATEAGLSSSSGTFATYLGKLRRLKLASGRNPIVVAETFQ